LFDDRRIRFRRRIRIHASDYWIRIRNTALYLLKTTSGFLGVASLYSVTSFRPVTTLHTNSLARGSRPRLYEDLHPHKV
jgi:hypothetical protein